MDTTFITTTTTGNDMTKQQIETIWNEMLKTLTDDNLKALFNGYTDNSNTPDPIILECIVREIIKRQITIKK